MINLYKMLKCLGICAVFLCSQTAMCQTLKTDTLKNKAQSKTQIIFMDDDKDAASVLQRKEKYVAYPQYFLKMRPFSIITGKVPIYLEVVQTKHLAYEVGLGITTQNFLFGTQYEGFFGSIYGNNSNGFSATTWNVAQNDLPISELGKTNQYTNAVSNLGVFGSVSGRYYFSKYTDNSRYLALTADFRNHKASAASYSGRTNNNPTGFDFDQNKRLTQRLNTQNISLNIGFTNQIGSLTFDNYFGLGLRRINSKQAAFGETVNGLPANGSFSYKNVEPIITSGFCIGFKLK